MDLRPSLTPVECAFARELFPLFEQVKSAVLLVAGNALLMGQSAEPNADTAVADSIVQANTLMAAALSTWRAYDCPPALHEEHGRVLHNMQRIGEVCAQFRARTADELLAGDTAWLETLSAAFDRLRQITLNYWRLELVPESVHQHQAAAH